MTWRERGRDAAVNLLVIVGALVACYGFWLAWAPLGVIALGLCVVALGVIVA